ncbi:MAG TPA: F420-dependent NADP oxidoreductase [Bacteroidales bacterium]|nr:F420-dependent NADP oxidoreductase [Bacteroidales bacterium]
MSKLAIIGAGNVANHLSKAFQKAEHDIVQVYSRTQGKAQALSSILNCSCTIDISALTDDADIYLFCISDSAIEEVLEKKDWHNKLLLHTAGSLPLEIFKNRSSDYGVLYPLQTFTTNFTLDITKVPFFIEGNNYTTLKTIKELASSISPQIFEADSQKRLQLHLAAVFANNFTNHMMAIASQLLEENNIPAENINPLLEETFKKAQTIGADKAQTGPAIRNNKAVMELHNHLLAKHPEWQKIYTFVSESIKKNTIHG